MASSSGEEGEAGDFFLVEDEVEVEPRDDAVVVVRDEGTAGFGVTFGVGEEETGTDLREEEREEEEVPVEERREAVGDIDSEAAEEVTEEEEKEEVEARLEFGFFTTVRVKAEPGRV